MYKVKYDNTYYYHFIDHIIIIALSYYTDTKECKVNMEIHTLYLSLWFEIFNIMYTIIVCGLWW